MATATNSFETGLATGTTITTANSSTGSAGTAFNSVFGTGTKTFESRTGGGLAAKMTSVGSTTSVLEWTTNVGTVATGGFAHANAEYMLPALPAAGSGGALIGLMVATSTSFVGDWRISETGKLEQRTGLGTLQNTSLNSITPGSWFKVHFSVLSVSNSGAGALRCRLFLDPTSNEPTETLTSPTTLNLGGTDISTYRFGTLRNLTDFTVYVDNARASTTAEATVNASVLTGPVSGALTDTGFKVFYQTRDSAALNHRLVVSTSVGLTSPVYSSTVTPDSDGFVQLTISGLSADTLYYYGVEVDSILLVSGRGSVRTDPTAGSKASHSIGFGSCQFTVPTSITFTRLKDYSGTYGRIRRFNHLGDLNYQDWTGSSTRQQIIDQHKVSMNSAVMQPLFASVAATYQWDNHDWGGDLSDKTNPIGATLGEVYRKMFPAYTLPATDGVGLWFSYVIGRIRYIAYDNRSQRDNYSVTDGPSKTLLGAEQKTWLKARFQDPEPVKIILSGIYWRQDSPASDRWGAYGYEFNELNDFIAASGKGKFYLVFGDRHALCADDGTAAGTRGMPQASGAPFQQGSVMSGEVWSAGYYSDPPNVIRGYGILDIADTGTQITINYKGISSDDNVTRVAMTTVFNIDQTGTATGFDDGDSFGTPAATTGPVTATATGVATGEAFGPPAATTGPITAAASGLGSDMAFGLPTVAQSTQVAATGVPSGEAFGLTAASTGPIALTATGIATGEAFGLPAEVPGPTTATATGVGSDLAFGLPSAAQGQQILFATGVPGAEQFGFPLAQVNQNATATSVADGAGVGVPSAATGPITVRPTGLGSDMAFGLPATSTGPVSFAAMSVVDFGIPGVPAVSAGPIPSQTIAPTGVSSGEAFGTGTQVWPGALTLPAMGIATGEAFGMVLSGVGPVTIAPLGIASALAFGDVHVIGGNSGQVLRATAVPSAEAFGEVLAFVTTGGDCDCSVPVAG